MPLQNRSKPSQIFYLVLALIGLLTVLSFLARLHL
jgi:hypothetical protein